MGRVDWVVRVVGGIFVGRRRVMSDREMGGNGARAETGVTD